MAEFETLESQQIPFNQGTEFFEITLGVVKDGDRQNRYLRIARGYVDGDGNDRYRRGGLTLPKEREAIDALADALKGFDLAKLEEKGAGDAADSA